MFAVPAAARTFAAIAEFAVGTTLVTRRSSTTRSTVGSLESAPVALTVTRTFTARTVFTRGSPGRIRFVLRPLCPKAEALQLTQIQLVELLLRLRILRRVVHAKTGALARA